MLKELLESKGFIESLDFTLQGENLVALERTRDIEQVIHHEATEEVLNEMGEQVSPASPAWDETIMVPETYLVTLPSVPELKRECVLNNDPALLVASYLKDKPVEENDSLNIELMLNGKDGWRFANVSAPSMDELFALIEPTISEMNQASTNVESLAYLASTDWYVTRWMEKGIPVPTEVSAARDLARSKVVTNAT